MFSYGGLMAKPEESSAGVIHITWLGLGMISVYSTISGMAGVYTEYILKGKYEAGSVCCPYDLLTQTDQWMMSCWRIGWCHLPCQLLCYLLSHLLSMSCAVSSTSSSAVIYCVICCVIYHIIC